MLRTLVRPVARQRHLLHFTGLNYGSNVPAASLGYATDESSKDEGDHEHEARAVSENASFFGAGVSATANAVKDKVSSAMGMSNGKSLSDKENMGPAGHMQGRDPNANPEDEYKSLKEKSRAGWDDAGQDKPPNQHYPGHGQNS